MAAQKHTISRQGSMWASDIITELESMHDGHIREGEQHDCPFDHFSRAMAYAGAGEAIQEIVTSAALANVESTDLMREYSPRKMARIVWEGAAWRRYSQQARDQFVGHRERILEDIPANAVAERTKYEQRLIPWSEFDLHS